MAAFELVLLGLVALVLGLLGGERFYDELRVALLFALLSAAALSSEAAYRWRRRGAQ